MDLKETPFLLLFPDVTQLTPMLLGICQSLERPSLDTLVGLILVLMPVRPQGDAGIGGYVLFPTKDQRRGHDLLTYSWDFLSARLPTSHLYTFSSPDCVISWTSLSSAELMACPQRVLVSHQ